MPQIKRIPEPKLYSEMRKKSDAMGETNDCVVIALALATGVSYAKSHEALRLSGRPFRQGTPRHVTEKAAMRLGFKVNIKDVSAIAYCETRWGDGYYGKVFTEIGKSIVASYPRAHQKLKSITTHHPRRFKSAWQAFMGAQSYMLMTTNHALAVVDGEVQDWTINRSKRVEEIWTFTRVGEG